MLTHDALNVYVNDRRQSREVAATAARTGRLLRRARLALQGPVPSPAPAPTPQTSSPVATPATGVATGIAGAEANRFGLAIDPFQGKFRLGGRDRGDRGGLAGF